MPPALLTNRDLDWQEIDHRQVELATTIAGDRLTVTLELDQSGNVIRTSSTMRKLKRDGKWVRTPWGGEFHDYAAVGALYFPRQGEAYWELEDGRYVYWRAAVIDAVALDEPFRRSTLAQRQVALDATSRWRLHRCRGGIDDNAGETFPRCLRGTKV